MGVFSNLFHTQTAFPVSLAQRLGLLVYLYNEDQLRLRYNTQLIERAYAAKDNFKEASKRFKNGEMSREDLNRVSDAARDLAHEVLRMSEIIRISPDADEKLRRHILTSENVHQIVEKGAAVEPQHLEALNEYRLGAEGMNKDCQALVIQTEKGPQILAQIFRYHAHVAQEGGGIKYRNLPGFVDDVKSTPVTALTGRENFVGYWTISSGLLDSGPVLVQKLGEVLPQGAIESTISPVRDFTVVEKDKTNPNYQTENLGFRDSMTKFASDDDVRRAVMVHLVQGKDSVRDFHLGNGAYIGWVHVNRDAPEGSPDWVTVNYIYDRNMLGDNKTHLKHGRFCVSPALQPFVDWDDRAKIHNICESDFIVRSAPNPCI